MNTKLCNACGRCKLVNEFSPDKRQRNGLQGRCKLCAAARKRKKYHHTKSDWTRRLAGSKAGRGIHLIPYLHTLFEAQQGRCFYTGVALDTTNVGENGAYSPFSVSIDQVIPGAGYFPGNIVLVSYSANLAKRAFTVTQFTEWVNAIRSNGHREYRLDGADVTGLVLGA